MKKIIALSLLAVAASFAAPQATPAQGDTTAPAKGSKAKKAKKSKKGADATTGTTTPTTDKK